MVIEQVNDFMQSLISQGISKDSALNELRKALETSSTEVATAYSGGRALQYEYLDSIMKNAILSSKEFTFGRRLYETPGLLKQIKTTEYKSVRKDAYGATGGAVVDENDVSDETNSEFNRLSTLVKTLSTKRGTTLHMKMADTIVDAEAEEYNDGALVLNTRREVMFFNGDKSVCPSEFDGISAKLPRATYSENIIDLRGKTIQTAEGEKALTQTGPRIIREKFGMITDLWTTPIIVDDIQALIRDRERYGAAEWKEKAMLNPNVVMQIGSAHGRFNMNENIFINYFEKPVIDISDKTPSIPSLGSITTPAGTGSKFAAADAGDYYYIIQPVNKYGRGTYVATTAVTVALGDKVVIPITDGVVKGTGYNIYRSKKDAVDASDCRLIARIPRTGVTTTFEDYNFTLPGTQRLFLLSMDPSYNAVNYAEFIAMMKFMLYSTNQPAFPFLVLHAGALIVDIPQRHLIIENVSPSDLGWY